MLAKTVKTINKHLGIDILNKNRKREYVTGRMFLYYFAYKKLNWSYHTISNQLSDEFGFVINRGSVRFAIGKAEYILPKDKTTLELVKANFPELIGSINETEKILLKAPINNKRRLALPDRFTKIFDLVKNLNKEQLADVEEMVSLRVKSYSWKTNDKCQIIEGYEKINAF